MYFDKFFSPNKYKQTNPELKANKTITSLNVELFKDTSTVCNNKLSFMLSHGKFNKKKLNCLQFHKNKINFNNTKIKISPTKIILVYLIKLNKSLNLSWLTLTLTSKTVIKKINSKIIEE